MTQDPRLARSEEIEAATKALKLSSDDHGHDCSALREYCELELSNYADTIVPWLLTELRRSIAVESVAVEALKYVIDREDFSFAECSEAEEIWSRCKTALADMGLQRIKK